jgi:hypothetical protein
MRGEFWISVEVRPWSSSNSTGGKTAQPSVGVSCDRPEAGFRRIAAAEALYDVRDPAALRALVTSLDDPAFPGKAKPIPVVRPGW